jgi:phage tail protein X
MTRETKIGLLVGLAFIIVIGILLSDHLTSSTEPPPATLAQTGSNVRQQVTTPGGTQGPVTPTVTAPPVQPQAPVPTIRELQPETPATAVVQVGGPGSQQPQTPVVTHTPQQDQPPITVVGNEPAPQPLQQPAAQPTRGGQPQPEQPVVAGVPDRQVPVGGDLAQIAQQHGETLVTATPGTPQRVVQPGQMSNGQPAAAAQLAGYREYTVQSGDSVSKLASRLMGGNTKANRDAILRANPSLAANPDMLIVGKTYKIPMPSSAANGAMTAPQTQTQTVPQQSVAQRATASTEYWYTVREGDTLTRIAREQLGQDETAIPAIIELNRDVIANPDSLRVNMKIRLPAKPLAQAN